MAWKKSEGTKHGSNCTMSFGRISKIDICKRCDELRKGAKPISWGINKSSNAYYDGGLSKPCSSNNGHHELNAGGYCNNCSAGRDHS